MLSDTFTLIDGSSVDNLAFKSGSSLPAGSIGELFYKTGSSQGLYIYDGTTWVLLGSGSGNGIVSGDTLPTGSYVGELFNKTGTNANTYMFNGSTWIALVNVWPTPTPAPVETIVDTNEGNLYSWGDNGNGAAGLLGLGDTTPRSVPTLIGTNTNWKYIVGGASHVYAITSSNDIYGWGNSNYGNLPGETGIKSSPVFLGTLNSWGVSSYKQITNGQDITTIIKDNGTLWMTGVNNYGQLGDGTTINKSTLIQIGTKTDWAKIKTGQYCTLALKTDGTLWSWGFNGNGRLGLGDMIDRSSPVQIGSASDWFKIFSFRTGPNFYAIKNNGTLWAWGSNGNYNFGDGTSNNRSTPYQIGTLTNWKSLSVGQYQVFAEKLDGTWWCWGLNVYGQLGIGANLTIISTPVFFASANIWQKINAETTSFVMGIKTNGTMWGWGSNSSYGNLGDGTTINRSWPVQIGSLTTWKNLGSTNYQSYAVKS